MYKCSIDPQSNGEACFSFLYFMELERVNRMSDERQVYNRIPALMLELQVQKILSASL